MNRRYTLSEAASHLSAVATGRSKAETVIRNARLINVHTAEIQDDIDIAIAMGRIALVGNAEHTIGPDTRVIDAKGMYAAPGFIDGHIHIESSLMMPGEYARAVVPHGTTSIFPDPHEIGNVFGAKGVKLMIENSRGVPLRCMFLMPSCVPAVKGFEDNGRAIDASEVREFLSMPEVAGLGEMMNYPGVLSGDEEAFDKICATLDEGKTVTGHFPISDDGHGCLSAYVASGCRCCHETANPEDALDKLRLGMYVQVREGSAWRDLHQVIRVVTERNIDTRLVCLASDDTHPHTLLASGHMDHIIRRAIEEGVNPIRAIQMATLNTAQSYSMEMDIGSIAPGRLADIVLLSDLARVEVRSVFINGAHVAEDGKPLFEVPNADIPKWALSGMNLKSVLSPDDFRVQAPMGARDAVRTRVIEVIDARAGTRACELDMPVLDGYVPSNTAEDVAKVAVIERHHGTGMVAVGFVKGFGLRRGAVASTVAHDAHNMVVVGTNDSDMAVAANELAKIGGGLIAVLGGEILAVLPLPIGGLMTTEDVSRISAKITNLDDSWKYMGCKLLSPFMTMALLSLAVIPELRITNRGLVDTVRFERTDLFV